MGRGTKERSGENAKRIGTNIGFYNASIKGGRREDEMLNLHGQSGLNLYFTKKWVKMRIKNY